MHSRPSLQNHQASPIKERRTRQAPPRKKSLFAAAVIIVGAAILAPLAYAVDYSNPHSRYGYQSGHGNRYGGHSRYSRHMWFKTNVQGAPRIVIDLSEQMAYFYKGGRLAGITPVSTGKAGHRTPTGNFRISQKKYNHRSNLYGHYVSRRGYVLRSNVDVRRHRKPAGAIFRGASMDYMMRINGPITMHAGHVPGYPASHGCIRLPWHMARIFYHHAKVGTRVSVVP
ncbi:L,D-transpeptidase family protein [Microbulbifer sp. SSSA002]|uniref:L,D-transpeptidase family protein n=1 Tax=unclassified Microbulbifer TaxID=2619833 RepID=UPI0040399774